MIGKTATVTIDGHTYEAKITKEIKEYEVFGPGDTVRIHKHRTFSDTPRTLITIGRDGFLNHRTTLFYPWGESYATSRYYYNDHFTSEKYEKVEFDG